MRVWRPQGSPLLELLWAQGSSHTARPHVHDELELGLALEHPRAVQVGGHWHAVAPGALSVSLPGELHAARSPTGAGAYRGVRVHPRLLQAAWQDVVPDVRPWPRLAPVQADPSVVRSVLALHRRAVHPAASAHELELLARTVLARLVHTAHAPPAVPLPLPQPIEEARERLEDTPSVNHSLAELARTAGLSRFHFARVFQASVGLSPHAYLLSVRIRRAKVLLLEDEPLAQLALRLGFASQSHFTQTFRRQVGVTPQRYRQDSKNVIDVLGR